MTKTRRFSVIFVFAALLAALFTFIAESCGPKPDPADKAAPHKQWESGRWANPKHPNIILRKGRSEPLPKEFD